MPTWWAEGLNLLHTFGFWFALAAVLIGIMIKYMIRPWMSKVVKAFHRMTDLINQLYEADLHPEKKDSKGHSVLLTRRELFAAFEQTKAYVAEIRSIKEILSGRLCTENCPAFHAIIKSLEAKEKYEKEFFNKLLELRKATQEEIVENIEQTKELYAHIHQFLNETLDKREKALDKKDEMLAMAMASLERVAAAERKHEGK